MGIAGCRLYLPIDRTRNSDGAGNPIGQAPRGIGDGQSSLDLPAFINALAPNGRMHFVEVKFVPIIGE